jgi:glycosyltransferase involved in cell wall biosynthesis
MPRRPRETPGPLRVLSVGAVGLRKGSPAVLETAKLLKGLCEFRMAGPLTASSKALSELSNYVELLGSIPRNELPSQYAWADVFFLPSLCEGSATAIYEALASGLPVLTTPGSGSVVRHGKEGFVFDPHDVPGMANALVHLSENRNELFEMGQEALKRAKDHTCEAYGKGLLDSLNI